jgi:hypothetical protein
MAGCAQDSIFYNISNEIVPKDPAIAGSPTKIIKADGEIFVASGSIYRYANDSVVWSWQPLESPNPGAFVSDISVVDTTLYALTGAGSNTEVWKRSDGVNWDPAPISNNTGYPSIQAIFGTAGITGDNKLFVAAGRPTSGNAEKVYDYAILYEDAGAFHILKEDTEKLSGAGKLGSTYYLGTLGKGIFSVPDGSLNDPNSVIPEAIVSTSGSNGIIAGLIQVVEKPSGDPLEYDLIIAVSRDGRLFTGNNVSESNIFEPYYIGTTFTGALALADATYRRTDGNGDPIDEVMLLIGIRGGNIYTYGYRERLFDLDNGRLPADDPASAHDNYKAPGSSAPSTVRNNPKYNTTLGKYPVKSIIAFTEPDSGTKLLFASTHSEGLFSYRNEEWNAEE